MHPLDIQSIVAFNTPLRYFTVFWLLYIIKIIFKTIILYLNMSMILLLINISIR